RQIEASDSGATLPAPIRRHLVDVAMEGGTEGLGEVGIQPQARHVAIDVRISGVRGLILRLRMEMQGAVQADRLRGEHIAIGAYVHRKLSVVEAARIDVDDFW